MVVYDDLESLEKLKVYDKRVNAIRRTDTFGEFQFSYHYGSVVSPYIRFEEPLRLEILHFLDCVRDRARPLTDGQNGLQVVRVIEAAQESLANGGAPVGIPIGGTHALSPVVPDAAANASTSATGVVLDLTRDGNGHEGESDPILDLGHASGDGHRTKAAEG